MSFSPVIVMQDDANKWPEKEDMMDKAHSELIPVHVITIQKLHNNRQPQNFNSHFPKDKNK